MSVSRETIAEVLGVNKNEIYCKNCVYFKPWYIHPICKAWDLDTRANDFCSFWTGGNKDGGQDS